MAAVLSENVLDQNGQNGPNYHFGQNDLILNWILTFARPKWSILARFGLKKSILVHFIGGSLRGVGVSDEGVPEFD